MASANALPTTAEDFRANLEAVRAQIDAAARAAGRSPSEVRLLPVSKTVSIERLRPAIDAGVQWLGENKVQEAAAKAEAFADLDVRISMIGHLQTNKAKDVAAFAHEFQALDSLKLAEALDRRLDALGRSLDVFVQVNTSGEDTKSGITPDEATELVTQLVPFQTLRVVGLMTIATNTTDTAEIRRCFSTLRTLRDQAQQGPGGEFLTELSMGMSGDMDLAIAEGATVVRVGTAIFGAR